MKLKPFALIFTSLTLAGAGALHAQDQALDRAENKAGGQPVPAALSDAQIAMIAVVADNVDIAAGKLALENAQDKRVKDFADLMVRDHSAVNDKANALAKKLGITPAESPTSKSLQTDGDRSLAQLKSLKGAEFDRAYLSHEVTYHQAVLDMLDKTLLPNTQNAELKGLLESSRPVFVTHLNHAKTLEAEIKK